MCKLFQKASRLGVLVGVVLLLSSCYYQEEDSTLYEVGDNFELCADSLSLQSSQPLHNLPIDTLCEQLHVYYGDPLVVAETLIIPEDSVDSIWVKLARDQYTMGWTHQRNFIGNVVPDDPISRFIHLFSIRHLGLFGILFAISLLALLYQIFVFVKPFVVHRKIINDRLLGFFQCLHSLSIFNKQSIYASIETAFPSDLMKYSASAIVLYGAKDTLTMPVTPNLSIKGSAHI